MSRKLTTAVPSILKLVGINSSGYAIPMAHGTASLKFAGIANETVDNSAGAAGDKSINVTVFPFLLFGACDE